MPKVLLLDADGVVLKKYPEYFSERFAREHGVPVEEMREFFKNEFKLCQTGKADAKEEFGKRLPVWGWDKGADAFLDYWFATDVILDEEVLKVVEEYRNIGIKCYLATDQEQYRGAYLWGLVGTRLDGHFFSHELGATKSQPEFFQQVLEKLNLPASEISYMDDDQQNVDVAKSLGINARFYRTIEDLKEINL